MSENILYTGAVTQASNFVVVKKFLINYIKKTYDFGNDIGTALAKNREPDMDEWMPTVRES